MKSSVLQHAPHCFKEYTLTFSKEQVSENHIIVGAHLHWTRNEETLTMLVPVTHISEKETASVRREQYYMRLLLSILLFSC